MFGYACDETPELMPLPIQLAHRSAAASPSCARPARLDYLRPDGKSQVTVEYDGHQPTRIDTVVLSTQHKDVPDARDAQMRAASSSSRSSSRSSRRT